MFRTSVVLLFWVALLFTAQGGDTAGTSCTDFQSSIGGKKAGYNSDSGRCYVLMDASKSFQQAQEMCLNSGGFLAAVRTPATLDYLRSSVLGDCKNSVWIGYSDVMTPGHWRWTSGDIAMGVGEKLFHNWVGKVPNVAGKRCARMNCKNGEWSAEKCDEAHGFICEKQGTQEGGSNGEENSAKDDGDSTQKMLAKMKTESTQIESLIKATRSKVTAELAKRDTQIKQVADDLKVQSKKYKDEVKDLREDKKILHALSGLGDRFASAVLRQYRKVRRALRNVSVVDDFHERMQKIELRLRVAYKQSRTMRRKQRVLGARLQRVEETIHKSEGALKKSEREFKRMNHDALLNGEELLLKVADVGPRLKVGIQDEKDSLKKFKEFMDKTGALLNTKDFDSTVDKYKKLVEEASTNLQSGLDTAMSWLKGGGMSCGCNRSLQSEAAEFNQLMVDTDEVKKTAADVEAGKATIKMGCTCEGTVQDTFAGDEIRKTRGSL